MSAIIYTLLFALQISFIHSAFPGIFTKCEFLDTTCFARQVQGTIPHLLSGIPELGTEPLDPMHIDNVHIDNAGLKMDISNAIIHGFGAAVIDKATMDPILKQVHLEYHTDLSMDSTYNAAGSLFEQPISGDGNMKIIANNVHFEVTIPFDVVKDARGKNVIEMKGFLYLVDFKDNVHYELTNLFHGNKGLSDSTHQFLNNNWKIVARAFGTPLLDRAKAKIFNALRLYLLSQPLDDLFRIVY